MKAILIFLMLTIPSVCFSKTIVLEGSVTEERERWATVGQQYRVPKCKKWLVQDIHKLGPGLWLEIEGVLELTSHYNVKGAGASFMRGHFTFSTSDATQKVYAVIHPDSMVQVRSLASEGGVGIVEFSWWEPEGECSASKS